MIDIEQMRLRYVGERDMYAKFAAAIAARLRAKLRETGIECVIEHRAKEVHSLLLKAVQKDKGYGTIGDKAGVRAALKYAKDRAAAAATIVAELHVVKQQDFEAPDDPSTFNYSGLHFDVEHEFDHQSLRCEVQLHTPGEAIWASTMHDLVYKGGEVPYEQRRAAHCLRALAVLYDRESIRLREELERSHMQRERDLLNLLRRHYMLFVASTGRADLSLELIGAIMHRLPGGNDGRYHQQIPAFVDDNRAKLAHIYGTRFGANPLLAQPESLLMFFMLDQDPTSLVDVWPAHLPALHPQKLSELWGVPVFSVED